MKFVKISMIILAVGILTNGIMVKANINDANAPKEVYVYEEIKAGSLVTATGRTWTKDDWSSQTYKNSKTLTTITNPCKDCKIKATVVNGNFTSSVITTMGQTKIFESAGFEGIWALTLERSGITAVKTTTTGTWTINGFK